MRFPAGFQADPYKEDGCHTDRARITVHARKCARPSRRNRAPARADRSPRRIMHQAPEHSPRCFAVIRARAHSARLRYRIAYSSGAGQSGIAQPFYINAPYGIVLAHNGNLTNSAQLKEALFRIDRRRLNTQSDSEVLLNVLAHELQQSSAGYALEPDALFA